MTSYTHTHIHFSYMSKSQNITKNHIQFTSKNPYSYPIHQIHPNSQNSQNRNLVHVETLDKENITKSLYDHNKENIIHILMIRCCLPATGMGHQV